MPNDDRRLRVFSYGGGVQSTAALVLAAQGRIDFPAFVFANVGEDSEHPDGAAVADAARHAALGAARDAAWAAARVAAWNAGSVAVSARTALRPTVEFLQESAHGLMARMIDVSR